MGFFSNLFRGAGPTGGWPAPPPAPPQVSLERQALETFGGRVRFGDPLDAAACLGRPDRFTGRSDGACTLAYFAWGLEVHFEEAKLVEAFFKIGDHYRESMPETSLAEPRAPDGQTLSNRTTVDEVLARFGAPHRRQDLDGETILYYTVGPLVSEFEFDESNQLTAWSVYLD